MDLPYTQTGECENPDEEQSREGKKADLLEKLTLENKSLKKAVLLMAFASIVLSVMLIAK